MDARWSTILLLACSLAYGSGQPASGAPVQLRTQNFVILEAPNEALAQQVGRAAEDFRRDLAMQWLGSELPPWPAPCTLRIIAGNIPAQGVTTYQRYPGYVGDFQMEVVGTPQRILDSVLPHEITHTVLATHFGRPLPRWADEGISTTVEHASEKAKHDAKLREFLHTRRGLPMNRMFMMKEYPSDMLPLYAQGYSVCRFLIEQNGHQGFIEFLEDYMTKSSWTDAVRRHYAYESLADLQDHWLAWVAEGSGPVERFVKHDQSDRARNPVQQASAIAASSGTRHDPPSMLASNISNSDSGSGWYQRRRQNVAQGAAIPAAAVASLQSGRPAGPSGAAASGAAAIAPYSVGQPQEEQGSVAAVAAGAASHWSPAADSNWR